MLKSYPFGPWTPDLGNSGLSEATNVRAIADGYTPARGFAAITGDLGGAFNGGAAFTAANGDTTLLASTTAKVREYTTSGWSDVLTAPATQRWRFTQFGDNILMCAGADIFSHALGSGTAAAVATAPDAIDVASVRDFVMCITTDNKVRWSQFNDSGTWTIGANQADEQPILTGGKGVRLIGGEYGVLLKQFGITRITYIGSDVVFQFDEISQEVGCMAAGSVCNVGRDIFFLSERGFMRCNGSEVAPIGDEKFNRWFFNTYSRVDIGNIWAAVDPRNSTVMWAMPGTQGRIIAYNYVLDRATVIQTDVAGLMTGLTTILTLDQLDAIYGNLDAISFSLDDPALAGGNPVLLVVNSSNLVGALSGSNLAATIELEDIEPAKGLRSRVRSIRLVGDTPSASAVIDSRMMISDTEGNSSTSTMRANGKLPVRANGRYHTARITIPAATEWSWVQGIEIEYEAEGGR